MGARFSLGTEHTSHRLTSKQTAGWRGQSEGYCLATSRWPRAKSLLVFHRYMARRKPPCRPGQNRQPGLLPEAVSMDTPGGTCGPAPLCQNSVERDSETFPANRHWSFWEHGSTFPLPTSFSGRVWSKILGRTGGVSRGAVQALWSHALIRGT